MIQIEVNEGKVPWGIGIGTILTGVVLGILTVCYSNASAAGRKVSYMGIVLIVSAGIWMCMDAKNRKLTVENTLLCYTNWFGRKTSFSLDEIGYCKTALEQNGGNRNYLTLYDLQGIKLCKLEYSMVNSALFLQYLIDNRVAIECSAESDLFLRRIVDMTALCPENVQEPVNALYQEVKALTAEWEKQNKQFDAIWKLGIAGYLEDALEEGKQLWEQKGYGSFSFAESGEKQECLQEGFFLVIEGYLQKDGQFVMDRKNQAVAICAQILYVSASMQAGEGLKIRFFRSALEELSMQLETMVHMLPKNRYHTEALSLHHELRQRL